MKCSSCQRFMQEWDAYVCLDCEKFFCERCADEHNEPTRLGWVEGL